MSDLLTEPRRADPIEIGCQIWDRGGHSRGMRHVPAGVAIAMDQTDDEAVFDDLYHRHYRAVLAYCRRRTNASDAQDAASEVFLVAWRRFNDRPSDDRILPWLYAIAYRVVGHQWRSQNRRRRLRERVVSIVEPSQPAPDAVVVRRAEDRRVVEAAARLRPADQEILRLAGWEQLPHADIATILGISPAAVDQRFHRAKKRLAREYDRFDLHDPATGSQGGTQ